MATQRCNSYDKIIAQTLFLGASVSNFNVSKGWGGQASQLTVNLVDDKNPFACLVGRGTSSAAISKQFPKSVDGTGPAVDDRNLSPAVDTYIGLPPTDITLSTFEYPNHYYNCTGIDCYIDTTGIAATTGTAGNPPTPGTKLEDLMVPGKVFYEFISNYAEPTGVFSKYWLNSDPGFFGKPNRINIDGTLITKYQSDNLNLNKGYDIINTPVYFKMGDFAFGGVVQSWSSSLNSGGENYTVNIAGFESVLSNCYVILDSFAGAVYSRTTSTETGTDNSFAGPRNYIGRESVDYYGPISSGNMPNVFNVYGFLESLGQGGFGGANINQDGISANKIVDALSVLTSSTVNSSPSFFSDMDLTARKDIYRDFGSKSAFSPFGRILVKTMQEFDTYNPVGTGFTRFGIIPPTLSYTSTRPDTNQVQIQDNYCQFVLDLSELPRSPNDYRIAGPVISIMDLINQITEESGYDYSISYYPTFFNNVLYNVIKVHTISRLSQPKTNNIENTIKLLQCQGYPISSVQVGKEKNETKARQMILGGKQQRLYQAKSLRLAYSQNTYIFNPVTYQFVDFMRMGSWKPDNLRTREPGSGVSEWYHHGKIKFPSFLSTRNVDLSAIINPAYSGFYEYQNKLQDKITTISGTFNTLDSKFSDAKNLGSNQFNPIQGNYGSANVVKQSGLNSSAASTSMTTGAWGSGSNERFFPIYMDVISPFFGFAMESEIAVDTGSGNNNDFRKLRPVFFDTWTGQLVILLGIFELPTTSVNLEGFYSSRGQSYFTLTENEMRAAIAGFENFLVYSLSKTYKNDIIEMVRGAFQKKKYADYLETGEYTADQALEESMDATDWYWKLTNSNIAGPFGQTIETAGDKGDGSATIDPEALKDLQIIHNFISDIAKYYGKKYMVHAPSLRSYRDDQFADVVLRTQVGDAYVFSGGGNLHYNYEPTNDGAWEEYGNIIDDTIAVGSTNWYNITDDVGKIKPIVGYNISENFDYIRYQICKMTTARANEYLRAKNDPFWSYDNYEYMMSVRDGTCSKNKFLVPSVDISSLGTTDYVTVEVEGVTDLGNLPAMFNQWQATGNRTPFNPGDYNFTKTTAKDAYGSGLFAADATPIPMKKLYATTSLEEKFVYLEPSKLYGPRILIDAPGLTLGFSSNEYSKDPNRTVLSNIAAEDLSIYLHSVSPNQWDYEWIRFMLFYTTPIAGLDSYMIGNYAASSNQSANFVEIAPKVAHPFFAGIPIKSNQYSYGPWTNYPYRQRDRIFTSGNNVTTSDSIPPSCTISPVTVGLAEARKAIDNWVPPTEVSIVEDFVPWNYGGMVFLDSAAQNEIEKKLNYQSVIETAQIDIPKLPIFSLGGAFTTGMLDPISPMTGELSISYIDFKDDDSYSRFLEILPINSGSIIPQPPKITSKNLDYKVFVVTGISVYTEGPIISNIQTSIGQGGITTTYHFRTYTQKLGLFNKQANDRLKKIGTEGFKRNKKIASIQQQTSNILNVQNKFLQEKRIENASFSGKDLSSKLFGWSPSTVLIGQANPYIRCPDRESPYLEPSGLYSQVTGLDLSGATRPSGFIWNPGKDRGTYSGVMNSGYLTDDLSSVALNSTLRYKTSVGLYQLKEVDAQIKKDHGLQSMMSIDGIFSPVSFYPTFKNSTYNYTLYDTYTCPFCKGSKKILTDYVFKKKDGNSKAYKDIKIYCDKCCRASENPVAMLKSTQTTSSSTQSIETLPPYIITSGTDITALDFIKKAGASVSALTTAAASSVSSSTSTIGVTIPINLATLNPIVVPYGILANTNVQLYSGAHPDGSGVHGDLSIGIYSSANPRMFHDRCRHSIEIVGRGAVKPKNIDINNSIDYYMGRKFIGKPQNQPDFYYNDLLLTKKRKEKEGIDVDYQMNQRFIGLRGPLVMHGWGYDLEGYPVPNAADEPYQVDKFSRPRRFKLLLRAENTTVNKKYEDVSDNKFVFRFTTATMTVLQAILTWAFPEPDPEDEQPVDPPELSDTEVVILQKCYFLVNNNLDWVKNFQLDVFCIDELEYVKDLIERSAASSAPNDFNFIVFEVIYETNMEHVGGFMDDNTAYPNDKTAGFQGPVISKTQRWKVKATNAYEDPPATTPGKWTDKQKLRDFYLNWAERTDLWPVGPIDLRWDESRRVWTTKSSDAASLYKMVYVTLEEDLVRDDGMDETYPARGFLDDLEYSTEPLAAGLRRLVFVKDKAGFSAPRGAKLLCRYDKDSGFYEAVSKPAFIAKGTIAPGSNQATLEMSYAPGKKRGEAYPTMLVLFENPFNLSTSGGNGLFTYINGKWTLTTST